ncbi:hypothetical protein R1flu_010321 [Riccia fluitans]|uniref:Uncharacterized protein n=1 Tax=Riccia fluitans TaxID=41844 RepID=A0ABD1Z4N4_9MARC
MWLNPVRTKGCPGRTEKKQQGTRRALHASEVGGDTGMPRLRTSKEGTPKQEEPMNTNAAKIVECAWSLNTDKVLEYSESTPKLPQNENKTDRQVGLAVKWNECRRWLPELTEDNESI